MTFLRALCLTVCLGLALPVGAQEATVPQVETVAEADALIGPTTPEAIDSGIVSSAEYADWLQTAARIEAISETGRGSEFALERLRADVVIWRDKFLSAQQVNTARIATVEAQIAALGASPAEGEPPLAEGIAARREALGRQLDRLRTPVALAREAYTHTNGLISEIDGLIRTRQANLLMTRGPSPLDPRVWPEVMTSMSDKLLGFWKEFTTSLRSTARHERLFEAMPTFLFYAVIALVLLARGRTWVRMWQGSVTARSKRGRGLWEFLISLWQIMLPLLGVIALSRALITSEMLGFRALALANALPDAAAFVIGALWLAGRFFSPESVNQPPLDFDATARAKARLVCVQIGWVLGLGAMLQVFLGTSETSQATAAVVFLPVQLLIAVLLFRLGRIFGAQHVELVPDAPNDLLLYRRRLLVIIGRVTLAVAVIGPILSLFGYAAAAEALIYPFVMTLAIVGVVIMLQGMVFDIYTLVTGGEDGSRDALVPLLIGFVLALLSLPVLSLVWGARIEDLFEVWARFREGYSIGETKISPTNFAAFVIIFIIGYMLTRLVQGTLRATVLPKTRIDIGGQNAIVSGLGYIGVFLAAVVAITGAGIDLSNLAIVAGALSVGIGFGLQNIVSNFVSGIILLIERPISEGDWIEVGGKMGYVRDISVRSTRIETFDRTDVIVPNADLVSSQVINWTRGSSVGRVIVPVGVAYGTDTAKVTEILRAIAEDHPMVLLAPPPSVVFTAFGPDSLNFEIRAIIRDVNFGLSVKSEMNHAIAKRFGEEGIVIPFQQRDVWVRRRKPDSQAPKALPPDMDPSA